jgi:antirestriction protein ArdC
MKKTDIYQTVTNRILTALEEGVIPWRKPFKSQFTPMPVNHSTGKVYRGINGFLLSLAGWQLGYPQNTWLTFNQAKKLGGYIKKGEHAETIVFWKPKQATTENPETGEEEISTIHIARSYSVFNIEQCEELDLDEHPVPIPTLGTADQVYTNFPEKRPELLPGNKAAYYPQMDRVRIPHPEDFNSTAGYYTTLFHELIHATGHNTRLNREGIAKAKSSDKIQYAQEELVAEMGASFLRAFTNINTSELTTNTTAYIQSWLKALADDKQMVVKAASQAQKAVDFMLGTGFENQP